MARQRLLVRNTSILAPLEPGFRPVSLGDRAFQRAASNGVPVNIAYERENSLVTREAVKVLPLADPRSAENLEFILDKVTSGVVHNGAHTVWFNGPQYLGKKLQEEFSLGGSRKWVVDDLSSTSYSQPFEVRIVCSKDMPAKNEATASLGGGLIGRRIGFDLGASDYKVAAFVGKECVFCEEFPWTPKGYKDPMKHYEALMVGLLEAYDKLGGKVDAIGGSSAGVWVNNWLRIGSIAKGIVEGKKGAEKSEAMDHFNRCLVDKIAEHFGVKPIIINDGNVAALAGHFFIPGAAGIVGIAMGSDEAGGYAYPEGRMDTKLYEWAFRRIDRSETAPVEEWSGLQGVGGMYFGQRAWNRLYPLAGIFDDEVGGADAPIPDKLVKLQELVDNGDGRALLIPHTIGVELGHAIPQYINDCGPTSHVLVVGRCMRGRSGDIILDRADEVLRTEFKSMYNFQLFNPDSEAFIQHVGTETAERFKTLGQAMAAASLPPADYK